MVFDMESNFMRDKKLHEITEQLYYAIDEKGHVIDLTDKGRNFLSPNNPYIEWLTLNGSSKNSTKLWNIHIKMQFCLVLMERLDLKDRKILYHLGLDSRQSFRAIGKKVGLSKDVVTNRVKKL